jgi:hypothetical protein
LLSPSTERYGSIRIRTPFFGSVKYFLASVPDVGVDGG